MLGATSSPRGPCPIRRKWSCSRSRSTVRSSAARRRVRRRVNRHGPRNSSIPRLRRGTPHDGDRNVTGAEERKIAELPYRIRRRAETIKLCRARSCPRLSPPWPYYYPWPTRMAGDSGAGGGTILVVAASLPDDDGRERRRVQVAGGHPLDVAPCHPGAACLKRSDSRARGRTLDGGQRLRDLG